VLSGYQPVLALKNKINTHRTGGISLRRGLIVLQFSISQVLIIGTLVISAQLDYFHNKPLGFNKEAIVMVSLPETPGKEVTTLRTQLNNLPGIQNVSFTAYAPSSRSSWWAPFTYESLGTDQEIVTEMRPADHTYIQTFGLQLLAGQDLRENGDSSEVVVNESLIHKMNIPNPADAIGKRVTMFDQKLTIVGVVKDFHSHSLRDNINQVMLMKRPFVRTAAIKLYLQNTGQTISQIEHIWKQTFPDHLFEYDFLDEQLNKFYQEEEKAAQLFHIFSGIAIFIGCLGLFGLVSFMAIQRTKEVGIRKALGASAMQIIALFYKEFVFLIALAFLIASPVAWFMMNRWLENFTYRINIGVDTFLIAIASSIAIALLTVSYQSIKAARANPVKSLRSE
jgi:ABC-type antimicrobial peptide transport system permease subunit